MDVAVRAQLQKAADRFRADLAKGFGGKWRIEGLAADPLDIDVTPDGVTWLAKIRCGQRVFLDRSVDPTAFQDNLVAVLVICARALSAPPERPS